MFFLLLVSYFFADPLPSFDWWVVPVGGEELKWRQLAHHQLMSQQGPHFSPHSKAKANYKSANLVTSGISIVAFASVYVLGKNLSEEIDEYDNYYYEFFARNNGFLAVTRNWLPLWN